MLDEPIRAATVSWNEQILTLNHQAFAAEQYETAYHLLAAVRSHLEPGRNA